MDAFIQKIQESDCRLTRLFDGSPSFSLNDAAKTMDIYRSVSAFLSLFLGMSGTASITPNFMTEEEFVLVGVRNYHQHFYLKYELAGDVVAILSLGRYERCDGRDELDAVGVFSFGGKQGLFQSKPGEDWLQATKRFVEMIR